ncbi:MAG: hypothetical protein L0H41_06420 [Microlunatus sp.]|nr:hypothetical protein [Microlunatus sp.]MDN5769851.1 hypothetical protein [Microlunatus sp.]
MTDVLVCLKRVPDAAGEITLSGDSMSIDARHVGYTVSAHEEAAVELAVQIADETGGSATAVSLGSGDAVEQLRNALAVGCSAAVLLEADAEAYGPADVAEALAAVVRDHAANGTTYDLLLLGNDAADSGDFQVPIRLAYALDRPVVTGISTVEIEGDHVTARGRGTEGPEIYEVPLPAVVAVMEGGVSPRYPSIRGRMKAKKVKIDQSEPSLQPAGNGRIKLVLPPAAPSKVEILGEGPEAATAVVDLLVRLGVAR